MAAKERAGAWGQSGKPSGGQAAGCTRTSMRLPRFAFPVLAAGVLCSLTWSFLLAQDQESSNFTAQNSKSKEPPRGKLLARRTPLVQLVDRVKGAVVNIHSERLVQGQAREELLALAPSQNRIN